MLAILLGAFGAHILKDKLSKSSMEAFQTAVQYHMFHGLALFFLTQLSIKIPRWIILNMMGGTFLFSGSLYLLSCFSGIKAYKIVPLLTPIGGILLIFSWLAVAIFYFKEKRNYKDI